MNEVINQNRLEKTQCFLTELPNVINNIIKAGSVVTRVVKNGFDSQGNQLVYVVYISLVRD